MDPYTADAAYRMVLEARIAELWRRREWYRTHLGWIIAQHVEDRHELRCLVRLARGARKAARIVEEHKDRQARRLAESWSEDLRQEAIA
jgi:hypothetical protein